MKPPMQMYNNYVLLLNAEEEKEENFSPGGLVLPESANKDNTVVATVIGDHAIYSAEGGKIIFDIPDQAVVLYTKGSGIEKKFDGVVHRIVHYTDLIARLS